MNAGSPTRAKFSPPALIAIIAAIASFAVGAFWGFVLALVAVCFGVIGIVLAFLPSERGGIVSVMAVLGGILGLIAAIVKGIGWLL